MATQERMISQNHTVHARQTAPPGEIWTDSLDPVKQLVEMGAAAVKLPENFYQKTPIEQPSGPALISVDEVVKKLASARETARMHGIDLSIIACTEARRAMAVRSDRDSHDRKYLSGMTYCGVRAYCGGLDAAISRSLIYAPHADIICFKSEVPDIPEARRFVTAIQSTFPEKQLAFGYSPKPNGPKWNESDHATFQSELHSIGFAYYFFTQFGFIIFPHFPSKQRWVMFDDALGNGPSNVGCIAHFHAPLRLRTEHS